MIAPLALADGEIQFYRDEGFLLLPGLLSERDANTLRQEVLENMSTLGLLVSGKKLTQTHEYLVDSNLDRFINSPNLKSIVEQLMGGEAALFYPFTAIKTVGGGRFDFHQDNQYTRFEDGMHGINCWFALGSMTPENGCLQILPRSHRKGTLESEESEDKDGHRRVKIDPADFLPLRMRAGDCVAFSRLTIHGSGANTTAEPRIGYAIQYYRTDARFLDKKDGQWKRLQDFPRYSTKPVEKLSVPTQKIDGH
jgi:phytanoyl-CoA hydroxylase